MAKPAKKKPAAKAPAKQPEAPKRDPEEVAAEEMRLRRANFGF